MNFPINWSNDGEVRRLFSWQARVGLGPKFGTRPIGWYQMHHCKVYDCITRQGGGMLQGKARVRNGKVYVGPFYAGTVSDLYSLADRLCREG